VTNQKKPSNGQRHKMFDGKCSPHFPCSLGRQNIQQFLYSPLASQNISFAIIIF
jgi:hypothetical protein